MPTFLAGEKIVMIAVLANVCFLEELPEAISCA